MRVSINSDEWYPVYDVWENEEWGLIELPIDLETLARWKSAKEAHRAVIDEIEQLYTEAIRKDLERG